MDNQVPPILSVKPSVLQQTWFNFWINPRHHVQYSVPFVMHNDWHTIYRETISQSWRQRERILKAGGFIHSGRVNGSLNLSRAIGDVELKQNKLLPPEKQIVTANPDVNIVELCDDNDFIVLACDGIWDCMTSQQLVDFVHENINKESNLSAVCEKELDRCLAPSTMGGEGCDNMTMILVQFKKLHADTKSASDAGLSTPPESTEIK